jgi:hypothetical protein
MSESAERSQCSGNQARPSLLSGRHGVGHMPPTYGDVVKLFTLDEEKSSQSSPRVLARPRFANTHPSFVGISPVAFDAQGRAVA